MKLLRPDRCPARSRTPRAEGKRKLDGGRKGHLDVEDTPARAGDANLNRSGREFGNEIRRRAFARCLYRFVLPSRWQERSQALFLLRVVLVGRKMGSVPPNGRTHAAPTTHATPKTNQVVTAPRSASPSGRTLLVEIGRTKESSFQWLRTNILSEGNPTKNSESALGAGASYKCTLEGTYETEDCTRSRTGGRSKRFACPDKPGWSNEPSAWCHEGA